jgi:hypothetical protein
LKGLRDDQFLDSRDHERLRNAFEWQFFDQNRVENDHSRLRRAHLGLPGKVATFRERLRPSGKGLRPSGKGCDLPGRVATFREGLRPSGEGCDLPRRPQRGHASRRAGPGCFHGNRSCCRDPHARLANGSCRTSRAASAACGNLTA